MYKINIFEKIRKNSQKTLASSIDGRCMISIAYYIYFFKMWRVIILKLKDFCIKEGKEYLLTEWDDEKNLPFAPETISHSSSVPVWWKCEKGHSWQTQLRSRSTTLTKCPKCLATELSKKRKQQVKEFAKKMSCK